MIVYSIEMKRRSYCTILVPYTYEFAHRAILNNVEAATARNEAPLVNRDAEGNIFNDHYKSFTES